MIDLPHIPPNKARYGGMTVNERLYAAGLTSAFDRAALARDRTQMVSILKSVELREDAEPIADAILVNPAKFGY